MAFGLVLHRPRSTSLSVGTHIEKTLSLRAVIFLANGCTVIVSEALTQPLVSNCRAFQNSPAEWHFTFYIAWPEGISGVTIYIPSCPIIWEIYGQVLSEIRNSYFFQRTYYKLILLEECLWKISFFSFPSCPYLDFCPQTPRWWQLTRFRLNQKFTGTEAPGALTQKTLLYLFKRPSNQGQIGWS